MTTALTRSYSYFLPSCFQPLARRPPACRTEWHDVYTFDKDKGDQSVCYDDCAVNWPPYVACRRQDAR